MGLFGDIFGKRRRQPTPDQIVDELKRLKNPYAANSRIAPLIHRAGRYAAETRREAPVIGRAIREGTRDVWEPPVEFVKEDVVLPAQRVGRAVAKEGRYLANTPVGKYVSPALASTKEGGLRPTALQLRKPFFGKVPTGNRPLEKMDPNLRSAINKARKELQKRAKMIWEEKYKKRLDETAKKFEEAADQLRKDEEELTRVTNILKQYVGEAKPPVDVSTEKAAESADAEMGTG